MRIKEKKCQSPAYLSSLDADPILKQVFGEFTPEGDCDPNESYGSKLDTAKAESAADNMLTAYYFLRLGKSIFGRPQSHRH